MIKPTAKRTQAAAPQAASKTAAKTAKTAKATIAAVLPVKAAAAKKPARPVKTVVVAVAPVAAAAAVPAAVAKKKAAPVKPSAVKTAVATPAAKVAAKTVKPVNQLPAKAAKSVVAAAVAVKKSPAKPAVKAAVKPVAAPVEASKPLAKSAAKVAPKVAEKAAPKTSPEAISKAIPKKPAAPKVAAVAAAPAVAVAIPVAVAAPPKAPIAKKTVAKAVPVKTVSAPAVPAAPVKAVAAKTSKAKPKVAAPTVAAVPAPAPVAAVVPGAPVQAVKPVKPVATAAQVKPPAGKKAAAKPAKPVKAAQPTQPVQAAKAAPSVPVAVPAAAPVAPVSAPAVIAAPAPVVASAAVPAPVPVPAPAPTQPQPQARQGRDGGRSKNKKSGKPGGRTQNAAPLRQDRIVPSPAAASQPTRPAPPVARPVAQPVAQAAPQAVARFALQRDGNSGGEGVERALADYRVSELAGSQSWRVSVRGAAPQDCRCTCAVFAFSEHGFCEHVDFALLTLLADRDSRDALVRGVQTDYSQISLSAGARHVLGWRQGRACPESVGRAAYALLDARGRLHAEADGALQQLLQLAAEAGHELRVDAAVWELLALGRDAAQRVQRLGEAYPQGLESSGLRGLLKLPLPHYQLEAAIYAACAGRSLVADDLGLGLFAPALAAAELLMQHFGVERVLVLCAESAQARWLTEAQTLSSAQADIVWGDTAARQAQLVAPGQLKVAATASLQQDFALLQGFAPELIIVDEAQRLDGDALAALKQLDSGFMLMLSGQILNGQPQDLLPLVELLDAQRSGPLAQFLRSHARRDELGRVVGFSALDDIDDSLECLMFSRSKAELLSALPLALVQLRAVALSEQQQALQAAPVAALRRSVARWQRSGYVSDAEQLQISRLLQGLRRLAISPQLLGEAGAGPKLAAATALSRELLGSAVERLLVCCQWDDALALLLPRLQSAGIAAVQIHADQPLAQRQALALRWRNGAGVTVLLCSDAAGLGLDLRVADAGLVNLELPWGDRLLEQRLSHLVDFADQDTRGLPLIQLQAQCGLEQAMLQVLDSQPDLSAGSLDGDASQQLLHGAELGRFMQALVAVCAALPL
jgi:hypothetical protein